MRIFEKANARWVAGEMINIEAGSFIFDLGVMRANAKSGDKSTGYPYVTSGRVRMFIKSQCGFVYLSPYINMDLFMEEVFKQLTLMSNEYYIKFNKYHLNEESPLEYNFHGLTTITSENTLQDSNMYNAPSKTECSRKIYIRTSGNHSDLVGKARFTWFVYNYDTLLSNIENYANPIIPPVTQLFSIAVEEHTNRLLIHNNTKLDNNLTFKDFVYTTKLLSFIKFPTVKDIIEEEKKNVSIQEKALAKAITKVKVVDDKFKCPACVHAPYSTRSGITKHLTSSNSCMEKASGLKIDNSNVRNMQALYKISQYPEAIPQWTESYSSSFLKILICEKRGIGLEIVKHYGNWELLSSYKNGYAYNCFYPTSHEIKWDMLTPDSSKPNNCDHCKTPLYDSYYRFDCGDNVHTYENVCAVCYHSLKWDNVKLLWRVKHPQTLANIIAERSKTYPLWGKYILDINEVFLAGKLQFQHVGYATLVKMGDFNGWHGSVSNFINHIRSTEILSTPIIPVNVVRLPDFS